MRCELFIVIRSLVDVVTNIVVAVVDFSVVFIVEIREETLVVELITHF